MQSNNKVNGEARCFLCLKDKLDNYTFQQDDFLSMVLKKKIYCHGDPNQTTLKNLVKKTTLNNIQLECQTLIKPCKCESYYHMPCLIQYCILHLSFKCNECQADYNIEFKKNPGAQSCDKAKLILLYIVTTVIHLGLLAVSIYLFFGKTFPEKYLFWNYFLGAIILLVNVLLSIMNFSMLVRKSQTINKIYPVFSQYSADNKNKGNEKRLRQMNLFLEQVLAANSYELIEMKTNNQMYINTTLSTYKVMNKYIIDNNNDIFDMNSNRVKDELKNDEIENKFHGHQIIKSSLIMDNQQIIKNVLTKKNTKTSKNLPEVPKLPKSLTKGMPTPNKKDNNPPRRSVNRLNDKQNDSADKMPLSETKEKIYADDVVNSKGKLVENQEVALNVEPKQTIEQQAIEKLTLMKRSSNSNVAECKNSKEEENKKDELIQLKGSK